MSLVTQEKIHEWKGRRSDSNSLIKALLCGWGQEHSLTFIESQLLMFMVMKGAKEFKDLSRSYRPAYGMDAWARNLGISRRALFRSVESLERKKLLVKAPGSPGHFRGAKAYGLPASVLDDCDRWIESHLAAHHHRPSALDLTSSSAENGQESAEGVTHPVPSPAPKSAEDDTPASPLSCGNVPYNTVLELGTQQATYVARRQGDGSLTDQTSTRTPGKGRSDVEIQDHERRVAAKSLEQFFIRSAMAANVEAPLAWPEFEEMLYVDLELLLRSWSEREVTAVIESWIALRASGEISGGSPVPSANLLQRFEVCAAHAGLSWEEVLRWRYPDLSPSEITALAGSTWRRGRGPGSPSAYLPSLITENTSPEDGPSKFR